MIMAKSQLAAMAATTICTKTSRRKDVQKKTSVHNRGFFVSNALIALRLE